MTTTEMQDQNHIESAANKIACWRALLESSACQKVIETYKKADASPALTEIATSAIKLSGDSTGQTSVEWFHAFALTQALDAEEALVMAGISSGVGTAPATMSEADLSLDPYRPGIFLTHADQHALTGNIPAARDVAAAQLAMRQLICGARYELNDYSNRRFDEAAFTSLAHRLISAIDSDFDQLTQTDRDLIHMAANNPDASIAVGSSPDRIGTRTLVFFRGGERSITELVGGMKDCPAIYLLKGKRWLSISYEDLVKLVHKTESPNAAAALATKQASGSQAAGDDQAVAVQAASDDQAVAVQATQPSDEAATAEVSTTAADQGEPVTQAA